MLFEILTIISPNLVAKLAIYYIASLLYALLLQEFYLSILLLLAVTVTAVMGYSSGAPESACDNLIPGHSPSQDTGPVPFIVNISSLNDGYVGGQSYTSEYLLTL